MVSASPFNGVKLDLAIILIIGVVFFMIVPQLIQSFAMQLLVLSLYGLVAMIWLIHKTRKILSKHAQERENEDA
jgi:ABC-type bacteriocin/lantibiotic exporter with double-glycine peptidase domain